MRMRLDRTNQDVERIDLDPINLGDDEEFFPYISVVHAKAIDGKIVASHVECDIQSSILRGQAIQFARGLALASDICKSAEEAGGCSNLVFNTDFKNVFSGQVSHKVLN